MPSHCYRMRVFDRDLIRGGHYGQRSCEPHLKAEHSCTDQCCKREESPCQLGAVHTWHMALICRFQRVPPTEESSRCCSCIRQREGRPTCWKPGSKSPNFHFSLRACSQQFLRLPEIFPSEPRPAPFVEAWLARAGSRPCAPSPSILLRTADILPTVPYRKTLPALQTRRRHQRSDQNRQLLK